MEIQLTDFMSYLSVKKDLSKNSLRHCEIRFKVINRYLKENELPLSTSTVEKFFYDLKSRGRSNACLNTYLFTLQFLRDYCKDREKPHEFLTGINAFKKKKSEIQILSLDEVERLLQVHLSYGHFHGKYNGQERYYTAEESTKLLDSVYSSFTMALAYTGARFTEMATLKVRQINFEMKKITFEETKTAIGRNVDICDELKDRLEELSEGKLYDDYVFTGLTGNHIIPQNFHADLKRRAETAEIHKARVYPHLLRHTFATHLLMYGANVDISMVATILGHKDIQTTYDTYVHLADEMIRKAHFSHPLIRRSTSPLETLQSLSQMIRKFKLDTDNRLGFRIEEANNSLAFTCYIK